MEKNIPTAEDILDILIQQKNNVSIEENSDSHQQNISILKGWCWLHVEEALEQASIKAELDLTDDYKGCTISKKTIVESYSEENIK